MRNGAHPCDRFEGEPMLAAVIMSICIGGIPLATTLIAWGLARRGYEQEGR